MQKRIEIWFIIALLLIVIGIADVFASGSYAMLVIPVALVAIVYLLYKFPPRRWATLFRKRPSESAKYKFAAKRTTMKHASNKRKHQLSVIEGSKKQDDDRTPTYH